MRKQHGNKPKGTGVSEVNPFMNHKIRKKVSSTGEITQGGNGNQSCQMSKKMTAMQSSNWQGLKLGTLAAVKFTFLLFYIPPHPHFFLSHLSALRPKRKFYIK